MEEQPIKKHKRKHLQNKHTDDLIDHYWYSIDYVYKLIKSSELKAGLILSFYGLILNFIYSNLSHVLDKVDHSLIMYILLGLWFACISVSIYFCVKCYIPRIEAKYDKNIFFFGDVVTKFGTIKEFSKTFYNISIEEEEVFDHLGQQIFIISKISSIKFGYVNKALKLLAVSLVFILAMVIYYIIYTFNI